MAAVIVESIGVAIDVLNIGIGVAEGDYGLADAIGSAINATWVVANDAAGRASGMYWTPYVEIPGVGHVYSKPAIVDIGGNGYACFYQGENPALGGDNGNIPYYVAKSFGLAGQDQPISFQPLPVAGPVGFASPPTGVMFNNEVYVFYGDPSSPGPLWYTVYNGAWSTPAVVPGVNTAVPGSSSPLPVSATVFTPPGATGAQLYVFYPTAGPANSQTSNISCVMTTDGATWTPVGNPAISGLASEWSVPSAVTYTPPGASSAQIYVFFTAWNNTTYDYTLYYCAYPDAGGQFSAPSALGSQPNNVNPFAAVYTPPDSTVPLIYVFTQESSDVPDSMTGQVGYNTFDGTTWSANTTVPNIPMNAYYGGFYPTVAVFPPESFNNQMAASTDIYIGSVQTETGGEVNIAQVGYSPFATFVGSMTQYQADIAPSQVTAFPAFQSAIENAGTVWSFLLAASLPSYASPQPWVLSLTSPANQVYLSTYTGSGWVQTPIPMPAAATATAPSAPAVTAVGSPTVAAIPGDYAVCMVFNTTSGVLAQTVNGGSTQWMPVMSAGIAASESPSLVTFNGTMYLFYQGSGSQAGQLWYATSIDGSTWSSGVQLPGVTCSESPCAAAFGDDLYVFYQGASSNGQLWYSCLSGASWGAPTQVIPTGCDATDVILSGSPAVCVYTPPGGTSQLTVFYAGAGSAGNWALTQCVLQSAGTWSQSEVSGVYIAGTPTAYAISGCGKLNVCYLSTTTPGQLCYSVFDGSAWQVEATLPVTTMAGSACGYMYQSPTGPLLYLLHNTTAGQLSYCVCTLASAAGPTAIASVVAGEPVMTDAPTAAVFDELVWLFYRGASNSSYSEGQLCYQTSPPPSSGIVLPWCYFANAVTGVSMSNSPSVAVFLSQLYVFYNASGTLDYSIVSPVGDRSTATTSSVATAANQAISSTQASTNIPIAGPCSPSAVVYNNTLYVFYVTDSASSNVFYTSTQDGITWTTGPATGLTAWSSVSAFLYNGELYLFYEGADNNAPSNLYYYVPFDNLAQPTQVRQLSTSNPPALSVFNDTLFCLSQGIQPLPTANNLTGIYDLQPTGQLYYDNTFDGKCWIWNTVISSVSGTASMAANSGPAAIVFPPQTAGSTDSALYGFYVDSSGHIPYVSTTDGTTWTLTPGLCVSNSSDPAYAQNSPAVTTFPPLDSPSDPDQLYVFWQGSAKAGTLWYATQTTTGWSDATQIVPTGYSAGSAIMSESPSAAVYPSPTEATASSPPLLYVFYQGCSGTGSYDTTSQPLKPLKYSVYSGDSWSESEVPVTCTTPSTYNGLSVDVQTINGIVDSSSPQAIVFNSTLYVFYVGTAIDYDYAKWTCVQPVMYSKYDGSTWQSGSCGDATATGIDPYNLYPVIFNGTLYVYFQNYLTPGGLYFVSTSNGSNWSAPAPATNITYVGSGAGASVNVAASISSDVNTAYGGVNACLQFMGAPQIQDMAGEAVGAFVAFI